MQSPATDVSVIGRICAGFPVVDDSPKIYGTQQHKKPFLLSTPHQDKLPLERKWSTIYQTDYERKCKQFPDVIRYHDIPSHELAVNPLSVKQDKLWSHVRTFPDDRWTNMNKHGSSSIPGLETASNVNMIKWQREKEITNNHPQMIIPKRRDIRQVRKYRLPYVETTNEKQYKVKAPSQLPSLSRAQVSQLLVSQNPYSGERSTNPCNFHI